MELSATMVSQKVAMTQNPSPVMGLYRTIAGVALFLAEFWIRLTRAIIEPGGTSKLAIDEVAKTGQGHWTLTGLWLCERGST